MAGTAGYDRVTGRRGGSAEAVEGGREVQSAVAPLCRRARVHVDIHERISWESEGRNGGGMVIHRYAFQPAAGKEGKRTRGKKGGERKVGGEPRKRGATVVARGEQIPRTTPGRSGDEAEARRRGATGGEGETTPATARLNANSLIDWISQSPRVSILASAFSPAIHVPVRVSVLFITRTGKGRIRQLATLALPRSSFLCSSSRQETRFSSILYPRCAPSLCSAGVTRRYQRFSFFFG